MSEFGEALRAWRDRTLPEQVGLPAGPGRRTPGLRREELAALAGISAEYVVRLEQGRAQHPSPALLAALARALRLTDDERAHLMRTAGADPVSRGLVPRHVPRGVQRIADRLGDLPLAVCSASWDLLQWNGLWSAVGGDPGAVSGLDRNVAWRHFVGARGAIVFDEQHARDFSADLAADLRDAVGRYPADAELRRLVLLLRRRSPEFAALWGEARVARHRSSTKTATATPVGAITLDCDVLTVPGEDLRIVVYTAAPGGEDASKLDLLRVAGAERWESAPSGTGAVPGPALEGRD